MLFGVAYVAPTALISNTATEFIPLGKGNVLMTPRDIAQEALTHLKFITTYIKPAMNQLADNIDNHILKEML